MKLKKMGIGKVIIHLNKDSRGNTRTITSVIHVTGKLTNLLPVKRLVEEKADDSFLRTRLLNLSESDCLISGQVQVSTTNVGDIYRLDLVPAEEYMMRNMFLHELRC
jgi:hypothetical protein